MRMTLSFCDSAATLSAATLPPEVVGSDQKPSEQLKEPGLICTP